MIRLPATVVVEEQEVWNRHWNYLCYRHAHWGDPALLLVELPQVSELDHSARRQSPTNLIVVVCSCRASLRQALLLDYLAPTLARSPGGRIAMIISSKFVPSDFTTAAGLLLSMWVSL